MLLLVNLMVCLTLIDQHGCVDSSMSTCMLAGAVVQLLNASYHGKNGINLIVIFSWQRDTGQCALYCTLVRVKLSLAGWASFLTPQLLW